MRSSRLKCWLILDRDCSDLGKRDNYLAAFNIAVQSHQKKVAFNPGIRTKAFFTNVDFALTSILMVSASNENGRRQVHDDFPILIECFNL